MAEFCLDCWNKLNGTHYTERDVILESDLCEGCGEIKDCIVVFREYPKWSLKDIFRQWKKKK